MILGQLKIYFVQVVGLSAKLMSPLLDLNNGGGTGIRTPETLLSTRFPGVRLKPLGHPSNQTWFEEHKYYCL